MPSPPSGADCSLPSIGQVQFGPDPLRYVFDGSTIWIVARDLLHILQLTVLDNVGRYLTKLDPAHRGWQAVPTTSGPQRTAVLSLAGAVAVTKHRKRPIDTRVREFLEAEAARLLPSPAAII